MIESCLSPIEPQYPPRLRELKRPPYPLGYVGDLSLLSQPIVAIVGTRVAPPEALEFARCVAFELAARGFVVASGGALGIDAAVHEGALAGGKTVVILPTSAACAVPPVHAALFRRIAEQGLILGVNPEAPFPMDFHYFARNEVLAALADDVVLVAAPLRSGARSTMRAARSLRRRSWAVPGHPSLVAYRGNLEELRLGARLFRGANDIPTNSLQPAGLSSASRQGSQIEARSLPTHATESPSQVCDDLEPTGLIAQLATGGTTRERGSPSAGTQPPGPSAGGLTKVSRSETTRGKLRRGAAVTAPASSTPTLPYLLSRFDEVTGAGGRVSEIVQLLQASPRFPDEIVALLGISIQEVQAMLLTWRVGGLVERTSDGRFQLASNSRAAPQST